MAASSRGRAGGGSFGGSISAAPVWIGMEPGRVEVAEIKGLGGDRGRCEESEVQAEEIGPPPGCWVATSSLTPTLLDRIRNACKEINRLKDSQDPAGSSMLYQAALVNRTSLFALELRPTFQEKCGTHEGSVFLQQVLQIVNEERDKEGQKMLVSQMQNQVVFIANSLYANYFLQACINSLPISAIKFVVHELLEDTKLTVARNQQGVRVLQRLIEQCCDTSVDAEVDEAISLLFSRIIENTKTLACHKYSQYILSAMCENGRGKWPLRVIEKLLTLPASHGVDGLVCIASHHYGCWVVQSALGFRPETDEECYKVIQLRSRVIDLDPETAGNLNKSKLKKKDKYSWISKMFRKQWACCTYEENGRAFVVHNRSNELMCINPRCRRPDPRHVPPHPPGL